MTFQEFIEQHENQALEIDIKKLQPQVYSKYLDLKLQLENADFEKEKKKALKEVKAGVTFFKKRILNFLKNDHFTTKYIGMTPPYIEHLRLYLMYKQLHSAYGEPTRKDQKDNPKYKFQFENNFDNTDPNDVYNHFYTKLVSTKKISESDLQEYLKTAFENKQIPEQRFTLNDIQKDRARSVFYQYYKIAGRPHGKQKVYAALLGEYFKSFDTENVSSNFSK